MVVAYWLIGREIVEEEQQGAERAEYGKRVIADLSQRLTDRYGRGFSVPNLRNFRQFYLVYRERVPAIRYPAGSESALLLGLDSPDGDFRRKDQPEVRKSDDQRYPVGSDLVAVSILTSLGRSTVP